MVFALKINLGYHGTGSEFWEELLRIRWNTFVHEYIGTCVYSYQDVRRNNNTVADRGESVCILESLRAFWKRI